MIAYEVLTGEKPFTADYLPTLLFKIVREEPVAPQRLNATLSADVETVMRRALSKNPANRYDTAGFCERAGQWRAMVPVTGSRCRAASREICRRRDRGRW